MISNGRIGPAGALGLQVTRAGGAVERVVDGELRRAFPDLGLWPHRAASLRDVVEHGVPQRGLPDLVNQWRLRNLPHLWRGLRRVALARALRLPHHYGQLWLTVIRADGRVEEFGLASLRVVTTAGVGYIVDAFQNSVELENMKYHGLGEGTTAEDVGDTALETELTTEYSSDNTRATGTTTEGASANIYRTVATNTVDGAAAVTEHGILSQAATGGGVLLDRTVFSVVNLASGDSLQSTYDLTFTAGS